MIIGLVIAGFAFLIGQAIYDLTHIGEYDGDTGYLAYSLTLIAIGLGIIIVGVMG